MREKVIACVAALMIIFLLAGGLPSVTGEPAPEYAVEVRRVAEIGGWGLVTVNDTVSVRNTSTPALGSLPVGLPRDLTTGLRYLGAKDDQGRLLTVERDLDPTSETYWFTVNFARTLAYNETYRLTVTYVFTNVLVPAPGGFQYKFVTTPVLRVKGSSENMTIIAGAESKFIIPEGFNLTETSEGGRVRLRGYFAPIEPYTTKSIVLNMTSTTQFIVRVLHASREIRFGQDGTIRVSDTYDFESLAGSVSTIQLTLPQNSSDVLAYDSVGQLWDTPQQGPDVSVGPRYPGGIATNRTFTFTLKYQIDPRTYVKQIQWWGGDSFKFSLLSNVKYWVVDKLEATVVLPDGFNVVTASPSPSSASNSPFYRDVKYDMTNVTPYTDLGLSMEYNYVPFWSGSLLLTWVAIIELAAVAFVLVLGMRKPAGAKIPVPSDKLKQFVELYDGRTALRLELDRMAQDLARGALNKHEYRRRRKTIEFRMGELDRALQPVRQDLKTLYPRYGEMILRLEKAGAEIDANRLGEDHLKTQYRTGKISKEAYERELQDLGRRIDKARETIETTLVTLREEAR